MDTLAQARSRYRAALELQFDSKVALVHELRLRFTEIQKLAEIDCTQADLDCMIEINAELNSLMKG